MTTLERVKRVVGEVMRVPDGALEVTARIEDLGESDSLTLAEIATSLDMEFGIRVPSEDMIDARSVGDLAALVERLLRTADSSRTS
ncbi:MAG: acyl carrier protein [Deltaproteobacteria bacterium]|nr:acyl carrier protein [Deltaproteobacteria bacterium]